MNSALIIKKFKSLCKEINMSKEIFKGRKVYEAEILGDIEARMDQLRDQVGNVENYGTEDDFKRLNEEYEFLEKKLKEVQKREGIKKDRFMEVRPIVYRLVQAQVYSNFGHNPARVVKEIIDDKLLNKTELKNLLNEVRNIRSFDKEIDEINRTRDLSKQNALDIQIADMVFEFRERMFMVDAQVINQGLPEEYHEIKTPRLKPLPKVTLSR